MKLRPESVRVLMNPHSGLTSSLYAVQQLVEEHWSSCCECSYQFTHDAADGTQKAARAVEEGISVILVVGGDGVVNSVGRAVMGSNTAMGVIPAGSGNGFARHLGMPLEWKKAIPALVRAERISIDVGLINGRPFFVTCSMAWDAMLVRTFNKFPFRGVMPYALSAVYEYFDYRSQPFRVKVDGGQPRDIDRPLVFTVANMTQYGGGAKIAPQASPDDGLLELVIIPQVETSKLLSSIPHLFDGTIDRVPYVKTERFSHLEISRDRADPIQIDGDLVEASADLEVVVKSKALKVLIPDEESRSIS